VDATDGTEEWSFSTGGSLVSSPTVAGDTVYVGSDDGSLYAVDAFDGTGVWNFSTGGPFTVAEEIRSSPTVAENTVYAGSFDGNLYAVDASDGTEVWNFSTGDSLGIGSSPTVAEGTAYVGSNGGTLHAVDASDGSELWEFPTRGAVASSPTVAGGTAYVGSFDGNLYALNTDHSGSSEGTRVLLGTLGHTDSFADLGPTQPGSGGTSLSVSASGDSASPGGQATVSVRANNVGSVRISNIPNNWTVDGSTDGGAFLGPDGPNGNQISDQGSVLWAWQDDQLGVDTDVTLGVPSGAEKRGYNLDVEAENAAGETGNDTATVTVQDCPFDPVVCNLDPNGDIDTGDLQNAINDFIQGNVDTGELQTVINAFIQGQ